MVNTGIFLLGCKLFFMELIGGWAAAAGVANADKYLLVGFVGINFLIEIVVNIVLAPVISRLIRYGKKQ